MHHPESTFLSSCPSWPSCSGFVPIIASGEPTVDAVFFSADWPFDLLKVGEVVVPATEERAERVCSLLVAAMPGSLLHRPLVLRHGESGDFVFLLREECQEEDQESLVAGLLRPL